jgi:histidinol-phosphate aminotransferase
MISISSRVQALVPRLGQPLERLAKEKGASRIVMLASNENPLGPSPKAIEAIKKYASEGHRYVDPTSDELVQVIAKKYGKKLGQIICGGGTDLLLAYVINTFAEDGDEILTSNGSFVGFYANVKKFGRKLKLVPLKNYAYDLEATAANITEQTKIIYLANPNNPTGTIFTKKEFENFMSRVPPSILVILDEAYFEYACWNPDYPDGMQYGHENLLVTRTFSKCYGMAGMRIGYVVGPEYLVKELYKIRLPYEPNCLALKAAIAALDDDDFIQKTIIANRQSLDLMKSKFDRLGIKWVETFANFLLLVFPSEKSAHDCFEGCLEKGVLVRHVKGYGIPEGVRINSGTEEETRYALEVIEQAYSKMRTESMEVSQTSSKTFQKAATP